MTRSSASTALPERLVIKYRDAAYAQSLRTTMAGPRFSGRLTRVRGMAMFGRQFDVVRPGPGVSAESLIKELEAEPGVEYAEVDRVRSINELTPNDPYFSYQWDYQATPPGSMDMLSAWEDVNGRTFPTVIVAVVDTGVAYENYKQFAISPDFTASQFVTPYNFVAGTTHANDDEGHGTHVSGTIAELTNNGVGVAGMAGILNNVKIMPVKVLDSTGNGYDTDVAAGINWAVDHGANIINMSLGGAGASQVLTDALAYAASHNVLSFCAAGNDYQNGNPVEYPAADPNCVAVGALDYAAARAYYSSTGPYVEIAAPGGDLNVDLNNDGYPDGILQLTFGSSPTQFGYYFYMGTSMATPHASGTAAVIWSLGLTNAAAVREFMDDTARDLGTPGRDDEFGFGQINMGAILANFPEGPANSRFNDDSLFAVPDLSALYFTSSRPDALRNAGPDRLWMIAKDPVTHEYQDPQELALFTPAQEQTNFPAGYNVISGALRPNQLELYLTLAHGATVDIWYGTRSSTAAAWGAFAPLPFTHAETARFGTPFLTSDGLTLYFASDRPCAACLTPDINLWYATRTSGQPPASFAIAPASETIMAAVNSHAASAVDPASYDDFSPSLTSDGLKIVFASNMGALPGDTDQDRIFMATRASATLPFGTPVELASDINVGENTWPFITADGKTLYFSTRRPGGLGQAELMLSNYDHGSFTPPEFLPPSANVYPGGCALATVSVKGMSAAAPWLVPFALPLLLLILLRARIRRFSHARERVEKR